MKKVVIIIGIVAVAIIALGITFSMEIERYNYQTSLFSGAAQAENFTRQNDFYPINEMQPADHPSALPVGDPFTLPSSFTFQEQTFNTTEFLDKTDTGALLVLHRGKLRYATYALPAGEDVAWLTHSISKTLVATAVGLAYQQGFINSLDDPIDHYVPMLSTSGYAGVSIRDVLQMSSGIRWNEDYSDPESDLNQFGITIFTGASYDEFVSTLVSEREPGTYNSYTGMDSQALTMLVRAVTEMSLSDYLSANVWQPLGMQDRAFWTTDKNGVELGLGGLSATARDLAKIGELYRNQGVWQGQQILNSDWIVQSTTATAPHLTRGENPNSKHTMGYGFQWWLPAGDEQDYAAIGIYNQFIYVNPKHATVIVKLSAYRDYANTSVPDPYLETETFSMFREIAAKVSERP